MYWPLLRFLYCTSGPASAMARSFLHPQAFELGGYASFSSHARRQMSAAASDGLTVPAALLRTPAEKRPAVLVRVHQMHQGSVPVARTIAALRPVPSDAIATVGDCVGLRFSLRSMHFWLCPEGWLVLASRGACKLCLSVPSQDEALASSRGARKLCLSTLPQDEARASTVYLRCYIALIT